MIILDETQITKAKQLIEDEMKDKGEVVDMFEDCASTRFIHQVAKEFYNSDDSLEMADSVFSDILSIMDDYDKTFIELDWNNGIVYKMKK